MEGKESSNKAASTQTRGASYPFIDLKEAVLKAHKFFKSEQRSAVPVSVAVGHFGYGEKSSGGRQTIATMLQYGLFLDEGSNDQRKIRLTKLGLDILLLPHDSAEWRTAIQTAAKSPKLFAEVLAHYQGPKLPSDATLRHFLITEKNLSAGAVDGAIKNLRATMAYAKLDGSVADSEIDPLLDGADKDRKEDKSAEIEDFIQWSPNGVDQFITPRRVRAVSEYGDWVFVDDSETGIPMIEVTVVQKGANLKMTPPPVLPLEKPIVSASGPAGETEWLRGPLSKSLSYRLLVTGDIGAKEISKLIKLLEAQRAVLSEDDDDEL